MKHILFFGDSLTAGYGLTNAAQQSFPALIKAELARKGYDWTITNAGLSGDTTGSGLARLPRYLDKPVDVFVLGLGANDMIRGYAPQDTKRNLGEIIAQVQDRNAAVKTLLLGMELPPWVPAGLAGGFRDIYRGVSDEKKTALLPFLLHDVVGHRELNLPDGMHPNASGYKVIAAAVWKMLEPLLV
ncbi:arylesterase [Pedobacter sp. SYP-B3415]|uniref:arylesterase n=1 Tax=Pedobacter sp. SYP-B3415 TaxID=2496641 RepID=UPI00101CF0D4|nr:arylesterase [Pedobacter sp. SYP-B3415]